MGREGGGGGRYLWSLLLLGSHPTDRVAGVTDRVVGDGQGCG